VLFGLEKKTSIYEDINADLENKTSEVIDLRGCVMLGKKIIVVQYASKHLLEYTLGI